MPAFGALHPGLGQCGDIRVDDRYLPLPGLGPEGLSGALCLLLVTAPAAFENLTIWKHQRTAFWTEHLFIADFRLNGGSIKTLLSKCHLAMHPDKYSENSC